MSAEYKLICHAECFADKVVNHDRQIGRVRRNGADTNIQRLRKKLCAVYVIFACDHRAAVVRIIAALTDNIKAVFKVFKR